MSYKKMVGKFINKLNKTESLSRKDGRLPAYYLDLNWKFCIKRLILDALSKFKKELSEGRVHVYIDDLEEDILNGKIKTQESYYGDNVCIRFGKNPIPYKPQGKQKLLSEDGTKLVFSYAIGAPIIALIYPPSSEQSSPERKFYAVDYWEWPNTITNEEINKLLFLFIEVQLLGSLLSPPRKKALLFAKLEARHIEITEGRSWIGGKVKYVTTFIRLARAIYKLAPN